MLNATRENLSRAAAEARDRTTPFQAEADAALAGFRSVRSDLERQVRRGDLTLKVARDRAADAAGQLRADLARRAEGYSPCPKAFQDRLIEASEARRRAKDTLSLEGLQRETNRLLRLNLLEGQIKARAVEFEGRTFLRPIAGGSPSPTLDSLLSFHRTARDSGDEVAEEWARRQLEGFRNRVFNDDDTRKIDLATDRPDRVNPRLVDVYVESLANHSPEELEAFVSRAIAEGDANACVASFVLARREPAGAAYRWVRQVLSGLPAFPDAALAILRTREAETRSSEAEAARAQADFAAARADAEVDLAGVEPPTEAELARSSRVASRPLALPGEAIGLTLGRRGIIDEGDLDAVAGSVAG